MRISSNPFLKKNRRGFYFSEKTSNGFTLIELVVTIGIIGILTALLLAAVAGGKGKALQIQCINNVRQLGIGLQSFLGDNHFYPLLITHTNHTSPEFDRFWTGQLERQGLGVSQPETNFYQKGVWHCPAAQWSASMLRAVSQSEAYYGYNDDRVGPNLRPIPPTNQLGLQGHYNSVTHTYKPIREGEVIIPSDMMAIGDSFDGSILFMRRNLTALEGFGNTLERHQGKANVVFCDGHVESPSLQYLFVDTGDDALSRWNRDHQPHRENISP